MGIDELEEEVEAIKIKSKEIKKRLRQDDKSDV